MDFSRVPAIDEASDLRRRLTEVHTELDSRSAVILMMLFHDPILISIILISIILIIYKYYYLRNTVYYYQQTHKPNIKRST